MKSSIKKLKNCKHILEVQLPIEIVNAEFEAVYKDIGKVAKIPGFRPGKVPRDLLEVHYKKDANEEVVKRLVPESYKKILEENKLDPIGYPEISDVRIDKEGFCYKASIETRPVFSLNSYKGLKLKRKPVDVKEQDVDKELEYLREAYAENVPKKDGEGKEKVLPKIDGEFSKDLGFENLEKLKEAVNKDLQAKKEQDSLIDLESQVVDTLINGIDFEIPESLINSEKERLLKDANLRLSYIEAIQKKQDPDKKFTLDEKDKKELEENASKQAARQVKVFFILDKIAVTEKIYVEEKELDAYIEEMAKHYKKTKEEIKHYLEEHNKIDEIAVTIRNKKVMDFLLKEAKVE
jgi:FKBP-type peptidyl-prolyl cis-trans isomerase (trigger factor)